MKRMSCMKLEVVGFMCDIDDDLLEQHNIDVDKCYYSQTTLEEKYKTNTY